MSARRADFTQQRTRYQVVLPHGGTWDCDGNLNCFIEDGCLCFCGPKDRLFKAFAPGQWLSVYTEFLSEGQWIAVRYDLEGLSELASA